MSKYEEIKKWFMAEVTERMDDMGLRTYHLTSLCHMTDIEVRRCLNGDALPGLFSLVLLAEHLECTVNDLLGYEEVEELEVFERYSASGMFFTESQYAVCLSERVRRYIDDKNMNFPDLEAKCGITSVSLRRWFAKTHPHLPGTEKFLIICDSLNCTPSDLLGY